jgi:hypothetical protein
MKKVPLGSFFFPLKKYLGKQYNYVAKVLLLKKSPHIYLFIFHSFIIESFPFS